MQTQITPINVCEVNEQGITKKYITLVNAETMHKKGLVSEQIIGQLINTDPNASIAPENFARNPAFVHFLHKVIKAYAPTLPAFQNSARSQHEGFVIIIDGRTPTPQGQVPPEDIIGLFQVKDGIVDPTSYNPNENHKLLTTKGFFQLESSLLECLLNEIANLN
jgi:hypothetical protein